MTFKKLMIAASIMSCGALYSIAKLDLRTGKKRELVPEMGKGIFGRFDVSHDAKKVVFNWEANVDTGFYLYGVNEDGTGVRAAIRRTQAERAIHHAHRPRMMQAVSPLRCTFERNQKHVSMLPARPTPLSKVSTWRRPCRTINDNP